MTSALVGLLLAASPWASMGDAQRADAMAHLKTLPTMRERLLEALHRALDRHHVVLHL